MRIAREALTFDDVLLQPDYSDVLPREVDLTTRLTAEIDLNIPLLSAAMDTVTESRLAIALAQEGGIGIIHKNMTPEEQAHEVLLVKKFESGIVRDPITVPPDMSIREVMGLTKAMNISGVPVVEGKRTVGIVTHRDLRFETQLDAPVSTVMTPEDRLITVREGADDDEVLSLLHKHRIEKVLVVNEDSELCGMITAKDFQKATDFPRACKDDRGALRVGAAVGTGYDTDERLNALVKAGVDVIVVDTSHGFSKGVLERVQRTKKQYPDLQLIGGNIVTSDAAEALIKAGVDGVKVGIGPGSICTTRVVAGVGVPQISAVAEIAESLAKKGVPVICLPAPRSHRAKSSFTRGDPTRRIAAWVRLARWARRMARQIVISRTPPRNWRNSCPRASRVVSRTKAAWLRSCTSSSAGCVLRWVTPAVTILMRCAHDRNS
jgi:IMP dehydrogenase